MFLDQIFTELYFVTFARDMCHKYELSLLNDVLFRVSAPGHVDTFRIFGHFLCSEYVKTAPCNGGEVTNAFENERSEQIVSDSASSLVQPTCTDLFSQQTPLRHSHTIWSFLGAFYCTHESSHF